MPTSERDLYLAAHDLHRAYRALDALKLTPEQPQGERVMRPAPGPRCPAPIILISLDAELTTRLQEIVYNASQDLGISVVAGRNGRTLTQWLKDHASKVVELPWVDDIHDELATQEARIGSYTARADIDQVARDELLAKAQSAGMLATAATAAKVATAMTGTPIDRKRVTYLGNSGRIATHQDTQGKACYKITEIVDYLRR